ncbi:hypothetical protein [uncultured Aquimarina sp.]|uniref:hypothetical protein n=1 Tax=uncultured Aquimarina sp. TaxID=575652 RepID=UPI00260E9457|nr:hypothetical protein [uncultured Aquimarina sp.]
MKDNTVANQENIDDEIIDIKSIFNLISIGFKNFLKLFVSIILFYKKKVILFSILFVLGIVIGYFLDDKLKNSKIFYQEIIIEPKYDTNNYIYDFIESLEYKLTDKSFSGKLQIDSSQISNLKQITLKPIIQVTDVLDNLKFKYGNQEFFQNILENYNEKTLEGSKYRNFYRFHKLKLYFKKESSNNEKLSKGILSYIDTNQYYNKSLDLNIKQTKFSLEKNKETLIYIEEYLDKLNKNPVNQQKEITVYAEESEISTISSLLKRKNDLITIINEQERILTLDKDLFDIIEYGDITSEPVGVHKRLVILLPLFLCLVSSLLFFLFYAYNWINSFIKD